MNANAKKDQKAKKMYYTTWWTTQWKYIYIN